MPAPLAATGVDRRGAATRPRRSAQLPKMPTMPRGKTSVVSTNRRAEEEQPDLGSRAGQPGLGQIDQDRAERSAPTSVPRPPTETQIAISIELPGENSLGLMMPTCGT